jgi:hypothetical protein
MESDSLWVSVKRNTRLDATVGEVVTLISVMQSTIVAIAMLELHEAKLHCR